MAEAPTPANIVVDIKLQVDADLNKFRVSATVQSLAGGVSLYNQSHTFVATYAEVIAWLAALVSTGDALIPLALAS